MDMLVGFTPIIILLFIVGLVLLVVFRVKRMPKKTNKYSYVKRVQWMFGAYMALLLVSVGVFYMLPIESNIVAEETDKLEKEEYLYSKAGKGKIETVDRSYIKQSWEFTVEGNELEFKVPNNEMSIFVEVNDELANTVKAEYYQAPVVIDGIDFTDRMNKPQITFSSGSMTVFEPERLEVKYAAFKESFVTRQFTGEGWMGDRTGLSQQLLYIQIPENVKLDYGPHVFVEYVGENK